jgi:hypothetical protein
MSTLKVAAINNASASSGGLAISSAGNVTGTGMDLITPTSIAYSGGSASVSGGAVTFSGVSSVSLNGVFSASYQRYLVHWSGGGTTSPGTDCRMRLRSAGSDVTAANYYMQRGQFYSTTGSGARATAQTYMICGFWDSISSTVASYQIDNPFVAATTQWLGHSGGNADTGNNAQWDSTYGSHSLTTSYDGFTMFPGAGTITGTVRVYGYRN